VSSDPPGTRLTDVHITGPGAVVGFTVGIQLDHVDDSVVSEVTVANSITHGIVASSVRGVEVTRSTLTRNGWFGLVLVSSEEGKIRNNVVSANGIARGAVTATTPESLALTLNTPLNQIGVGIAVLGGSDNLLDRNSVTGNFGIGIAVDGNSIFNTLRQNQAAGNQTFGQAANAGRFTNLFIGAGSTGNQVTHNVLLSVEDDNECDRNLFSNNTIITTYSSNGTRAPVGAEGTYLAPLSLVTAWVTSPSTCIR
jgi:parallel beta-helix repeat protein